LQPPDFYICILLTIWLGGKIMRQPAMLLAVCVAAGLAASCSSTGSGSTTSTNASETPPASATAQAGSVPAAAEAEAEKVAAAAAGADSATGKQGQAAALAQADDSPAAAPAQCTMQIAGGPPAKPAKGADFGEAVVKDTGKAAGRGAIQLAGGLLGGGLGSAVAGGLAQSTIRSEGDIKGVWTITDGSPECGCQIGIDGFFMQQGKGNDTGSVKLKGCSNPQIAQAAAWALGYSFTGYDAKFELKAKDKRTVLATLNRDGMHYFSGTLADGTPVVMWRDGQTYNQLATFK
jgi:hypothetical protein